MTTNFFRNNNKKINIPLACVRLQRRLPPHSPELTRAERLRRTRKQDRLERPPRGLMCVRYPSYAGYNARISASIRKWKDLFSCDSVDACN